MSIIDNRKALHDYFIEERYEAGIALEGWEVKAIRGGRAQISEAYVMVRGEEIFLIGAHISPLPTVSTHFTPDPTRSRKLLLATQASQGLLAFALGMLTLTGVVVLWMVWIKIPKQQNQAMNEELVLRTVGLATPVNNRLDPALLSPAALRISARMPKSTDPCGQITYEIGNDSDEHQTLGRIDFPLTPDHSVFGRYFGQK